MVVFPNCKINLGLRILSKREDNYHELETIMYPIPLYDILEIVPNPTFEFVQTGIDVAVDLEQNICVKAYRLFQNEFSISPVRIHLHKQLPMGAGMGGGSADGTFVLKTLNSLFNLQLSEADLLYWSAFLGSDCPFFINNNAQLAKGRGDVLQPISVSLKGKYLAIVQPNIHISTKDAFENVFISGKANELVLDIQKPIREWKSIIQNDFENHIFEKYPLLRDLKETFYQNGALYASLTGSGSVVYGIFDFIPSGYSRVIEL